MTSNSELSVWEIRLFGGFTLTSPSGSNVPLPDRKTEAVLAVLLANRDLGIDRQTLASIVWPAKGSNGLVSLRRSLSVLRRILGPDALESSHTHCRLSDQFAYRSDLDVPALRSSSGFMPGHSGDWFDEMRLDSVLIDSPKASHAPLSEYFTTLRWLASRDAGGFYGVLRETAGMARSLSFSQLSDVLSASWRPDTPLAPYYFWKATVEDDLAECVSLLRSALKAARASGDLSLASEICVELGRAYVRTGQPQRALSVCQVADELSQRLGSRTSRINAMRLRATILFQWQSPKEGRELLIQLENLLSEPSDVATILSLRAWFEASAGSYQAAESTLKRSLNTIGSGHFRIDLLHESTSVLLEVARGNGDRLIPKLESMAKVYASQGSSQFAAYTHELLETLYRAKGELVASERSGRAAQKSRSLASMSWTPLEKRRVALIGAR